MIGKGGIKSGEVVAFLGKNISFEGKMGFDGMATLDGKFDGEIFCEHMLIIGETGNVNAQITVSTLVIEGKVCGNVSATDRIEIHATGQLYGNITTPILVIEEGGVFDGTARWKKGSRQRKRLLPLRKRRPNGSRDR